MYTVEKMCKDLQSLGLKQGDTVMMHSSFKSLGKIENGAQSVFDALLTVLGSEGTLILPSFSYDFVTYEHPIFNLQTTPSCVGYLPEYFRTKIPGVKRSMHATHSCSVIGALTDEMLRNHELDLTPVGVNSPISKLPKVGGKILLLGSPKDSITSFHGIEELIEPEYLFDYEKPIEYILQDGSNEIRQNATHHSFHKNGFYYEQKYSRIFDLLDETEYKFGKVLDADCYLLSAESVWRKGYEALKENPLYFVDKIKI